jgi:hypothetical protein
MSTAKTAIAAIIDRLEEILVVDDYNTNAGNQVYKGVRTFDKEYATFPLLVVFSGDETPIGEAGFGEIDVERSVTIEGWVNDTTDAVGALEDLVEDVQTAIEQHDVTLGGTVSMLQYQGIEALDPAEAGSTISGLRISYSFRYQRPYGSQA